MVRELTYSLIICSICTADANLQAIFGTLNL